MNLNRLLNQVYLNRQDLPVPKWSRKRPKPGDSMPAMMPYSSRDISHLLGRSYSETMDPFIFDQKLIETTEQLHDIIFLHTERVELSLLANIHNILRFEFMRAGLTTLTNQQFSLLSLSEKCNYLEMDAYLLDRNLNDLFHYEIFLSRKDI